MTSHRTRVSPGSAAARLARWRWHRNPGGLKLSKKLGARLLEWHGGQSSALYKLGSRAYGGHPVQSPGDVDDALWELNRAYEGMLKPKDVRHLDATIKMLERESGHQNRNNPIRGKYAGPVYRLHDGDVVDAAQLRRMFMGKLPGPTHRRLLGITKVKKNPKRPVKVDTPYKGSWAEQEAARRAAYRHEDRKRDTRSVQEVLGAIPCGKRNPGRGRRLAKSRCRILSRATLRARINKASGGARNAVMRSILAQVMAGKVKIRGARISAAVKRGIRHGRR